MRLPHLPLRKRFRAHKLLLVVLGAAGAVALLHSPAFHEAVRALGGLGYAGGLVAGFFFSYGITTIPALAAFAVLAETLEPLPLALVGALGAVGSDFLIFHVLRNDVVPEARRLSRRFHFHPQKRLIRRLRRVSPALGGLVLASPLPDEVAMALFGVSHLRNRNWLLIAFTAKFLAILAVALVAGGW